MFNLPSSLNSDEQQPIAYKRQASPVEEGAEQIATKIPRSDSSTLDILSGDLFGAASTSSGCQDPSTSTASTAMPIFSEEILADMLQFFGKYNVNSEDGSVTPPRQEPVSEENTSPPVSDKAPPEENSPSRYNESNSSRQYVGIITPPKMMAEPSLPLTVAPDGTVSYKLPDLGMAATQLSVPPYRPRDLKRVVENYGEDYIDKIDLESPADLSLDLKEHIAEQLIKPDSLKSQGAWDFPPSPPDDELLVDAATGGFSSDENDEDDPDASLGRLYSTDSREVLPSTSTSCDKSAASMAMSFFHATKHLEKEKLPEWFEQDYLDPQRPDITAVDVQAGAQKSLDSLVESFGPLTKPFCEKILAMYESEETLLGIADKNLVVRMKSFPTEQDQNAHPEDQSTHPEGESTHLEGESLSQESGCVPAGSLVSYVNSMWDGLRLSTPDIAVPFSLVRDGERFSESAASNLREVLSRDNSPWPVRFQLSHQEDGNMSWMVARYESLKNRLTANDQLAYFKIYKSRIEQCVIPGKTLGEGYCEENDIMKLEILRDMLYPPSAFSDVECGVMNFLNLQVAMKFTNLLSFTCLLISSTPSGALLDYLKFLIRHSSVYAYFQYSSPNEHDLIMNKSAFKIRFRHLERLQAFVRLSWTALGTVSKLYSPNSKVRKYLSYLHEAFLDALAVGSLKFSGFNNGSDISRAHLESRSRKGNLIRIHRAAQRYLREVDATIAHKLDKKPVFLTNTTTAPAAGSGGGKADSAEIRPSPYRMRKGEDPMIELLREVDLDEFCSFDQKHFQKNTVTPVWILTHEGKINIPHFPSLQPEMQPLVETLERMHLTKGERLFLRGGLVKLKVGKRRWKYNIAPVPYPLAVGFADGTREISALISKIIEPDLWASLTVIAEKVDAEIAKRLEGREVPSNYMRPVLKMLASNICQYYLKLASCEETKRKVTLRRNLHFLMKYFTSYRDVYSTYPHLLRNVTEFAPRKALEIPDGLRILIRLCTFTELIAIRLKALLKCVEYASTFHALTQLRGSLERFFTKLWGTYLEALRIDRAECIAPTQTDIKHYRRRFESCYNDRNRPMHVYGFFAHRYFAGEPILVLEEHTEPHPDELPVKLLPDDEPPVVVLSDDQSPEN